MKSPNPKRRPGWLAAPLLAMTVGLTGCISGMVNQYFSGMTKELQEHGVSAEATILKVWDTGWTVNEDPVVGMEVEVRPPEGPVFEATIKKTLISRIDLPQFQPGRVVPVRYDPKNPAVVAVDFGGQVASSGGPVASSGGSGNPYRDRFVRAPTGTAFLPPPPGLHVYLGTADSVADEVALAENGYALLGESVVEGGSNLQQAIDQGKEVGAAMVVVYGHFDLPAGLTLTVLPYQARPRETAEPGQSDASQPVEESLVPRMAGTERAALYFGRNRPPILGVLLRALDDREKTRLSLENGVAVVAVDEGSPAAASHIQRGDILLAIDGKAVVDLAGTAALLKSAAGRAAVIDLERGGERLSVAVQLNPAGQ
jgi:S1-C subfamily serine protease